MSARSCQRVCAYSGGMRVETIDERKVYERDGNNFVVFIYRGSDRPNVSWSVHSYLLTDADLPEALLWLTENLPTESDANAIQTPSPVGP